MKVCTKCGLEKTDEEFQFKNKNKNIRRSSCKTCVAEYGKTFYSLHPYRKEKLKPQGKQRRIRNRKYINDYLKEHPCIDCGETDPIVLDFDHVRGKKKFNICNFREKSITALQNEIKKCDIRCANCHRRVTYYRLFPKVA